MSWPFGRAGRDGREPAVAPRGGCTPRPVGCGPGHAGLRWPVQGRNRPLSMRGRQGLRPWRRAARDEATSSPWAGFGHRQLGHRSA